MSDDLRRKIDRILGGLPSTPPKPPPRRLRLPSLPWAKIGLAALVALLVTGGGLAFLRWGPGRGPGRFALSEIASWPSFSRLISTPGWIRLGNDDVLLAADSGAKLHAWDGATGRKRFQVSLEAAVLAPVLLCDLTGDGREDVTVAEENGRIETFDAEGKPLWKSRGDVRSVRIVSPPRARRLGGRDVLVVADSAGSVFCVDAAYGNLVWAREDSALEGAEIFGGPAVLPDRWVYANRAGTVVALDATDGHPLWTSSVSNAVRAGVVALPGHGILVCDEAGGARVLDGRDGRILRATNLGSPILSTPAFDGERIFVGTLDGKVVALHPRSLEILARFDSGAGDGFRASPALADFNGDGRADVVFASGDGWIFVLDGRSFSLLAPAYRAADGLTASPLVARGVRGTGLLVAGESGSLRWLAIRPDPERPVHDKADWRQFGGESGYNLGK